MRFGSLFSGIEAASAAWLPLGWSCAWVSEIDPFACAVLAHHYPHTPNLGDVNRIDPDAVEPVDLVVFGSPCQSFSVAGKRLGLDDPRGNMALVGLRLIGRIRPRWVVWENVPGVLSSDNGRDFGAFLGLLGELGYGFAYRVLDAQHAGVPQRRRRVFVVGYLGDWRPAAAVLFEPESLRGDPPPRREAGQRTSPSLAPGTGGGSGHQYRQKGNEDALIPEIAASKRNSSFDSGKQPCPRFDPRDFSRHPCPKCDGLVAFCGNCGFDHHQHGWEICSSINIGDPRDAARDLSPMAPFLRRLASGQRHPVRGRRLPVVRGPLEDCQNLGSRGIDRGDRQLVAFGGNNTSGPIDVATACNAHGGRLDFESETLIAHSLRADGFDAGEDGTGRGTPLVAVDWQNSAGGPNSEDTFMTLGVERTPAVMTAVPLLEIGKRTNSDGYRDGDGIGHDGDPMYSLQAGAQHGVMTLAIRGRGDKRMWVVLANTSSRSLDTVLARRQSEAAKL